MLSSLNKLCRYLQRRRTNLYQEGPWSDTAVNAGKELLQNKYEVSSSNIPIRSHCSLKNICHLLQEDTKKLLLMGRGGRVISVVNMYGGVQCPFINGQAFS